MYLFQQRTSDAFPRLPLPKAGYDPAGQATWEKPSMAVLDAWILDNLDETKGQRPLLVDGLASIARPFGWPSSKIMRTLGDRYAANVA